MEKIIKVAITSQNLKDANSYGFDPCPLELALREKGFEADAIVTNLYINKVKYNIPNSWSSETDEGFVFITDEGEGLTEADVDEKIREAKQGIILEPFHITLTRAD